MELAYQAEVLTPSKCGRMDQACAFGSQPVAITYDADHLEVAPLQVRLPTLGDFGLDGCCECYRSGLHFIT